MDQDRYKRGLKKLEEVVGEGGRKVIESLKDISPDLGRYMIKFPFGDIYCRSALDLKSRHNGEWEKDLFPQYCFEGGAS